ERDAERTDRSLGVPGYEDPQDEHGSADGLSEAVPTVGADLGAFVGAVLCWLTFKKHFDEDCDPALKLGVFSTGPE
ncbi:hypothetical protein NE682_17065, partial [[Eubacterium] rectale]|nr:hypothetical protein [Agathobacter rectalis]